MAKKDSKVLNFVAWFTGIVVSLAVGFGMTEGTLGLPIWLGGTIGIPVIVGWIVVITTLIGVVLAIINQ